MAVLFDYVYDTINRSHEWGNYRGDINGISEDMTDVCMDFLDTNVGDRITSNVRGMANIMDGLVGFVLSNMRNDSRNEIQMLAEAYMCEVMSNSFSVQEIRNDRKLAELMNEVEANNPLLNQRNQRSHHRHHQHRGVASRSSSNVQYRNQERYDNRQHHRRGYQHMDTGLDKPRILQPDGTPYVHRPVIVETQRPEINNVESKQVTVERVEPPKPEPVKHHYVYWAGYEQVVVNSKGEYLIKKGGSVVDFDYELHRTDKIVPEIRNTLNSNTAITPYTINGMVEDVVSKRVNDYLETITDGDDEETIVYKLSNDNRFTLNDLQLLHLGISGHDKLNELFSSAVDKTLNDVETMSIVYPVVNHTKKPNKHIDSCISHKTWCEFLNSDFVKELDIPALKMLQCYVDEALNIAFIEQGHTMEIEGTFNHVSDLIEWMNSELDPDSRHLFDASITSYLNLTTAAPDEEKEQYLAIRENVVYLPVNACHLPIYNGGKNAETGAGTNVVLKDSLLYVMLKDLFKVRADENDDQPINNLILLFSDNVCMSLYHSKISENMYLFVRSK